MNVNISYEDMMRPVAMPDDPFSDRNRFPNQNALAGHVEEHEMTDHAFRRQHLTYSILGYSANPSMDPNAPAILGSVEKAAANGFATHDILGVNHAEKKELKRKRKKKGDLEIVDGDGAYVGPWAKWQGDEEVNDLPEGTYDAGGDEDEEEEEEDQTVSKKRARRKLGAPGQESSTFHGKSMTDYQGRTYMHPPLAEAPHLTQEPGSQECFIPKACVHTWTGHTQGVSVIKLFPQTAHLMLSGSMDTKIKVISFPSYVVAKPFAYILQLWDVYTHGNCLRTFMGHVKPVKDVSFSNDGRRFLSCGYDRQMKLWDTETGQCIKRFSNGKIPYVIKFHPDDDKQNIFLAGMSDKKIIQVSICIDVSVYMDLLTYSPLF